MSKRWKHNARSPVLFFIDDLTNRWIDIDNDGIVKAQGDYGFQGFSSNGSFAHLKEHVLCANPKIKTTFFCVAGPMSPMTTEMEDINHSFQLGSTPESRHFFKTLHNSEMFELAYHGRTHGSSGNNEAGFIHEWEGFRSLEEALRETEQGKSIFLGAVGAIPTGGKYCGYKSNEFSDQSVERSGFRWWCRTYNRGSVLKGKNPREEYGVSFFGAGRVIDIPTTIPGNLLNGVYAKGKGIRGFAKALLRPFLKWWELRHIRFLLRHGLVISIQEHISPSRGDNVRQTPNMFDDSESLKAIFSYLKRKNVWYCTCSELADWIRGEGKNS